MAAQLPPFITWRDARPRFNPGPAERRLGFAGEDLRHDGPQGARTGGWLTFEQAHAWGTVRHAEILAARALGRRPEPVVPRGKTLADLLDDWFDSPDVQSLAAKTVDGYRKQVLAVKFQPRSADDRAAKRPKLREAFSLAPVSALGAPELKAFFDYQRRARGHHMALASIAVVSAAWTWGRTSTRWRLGANPRLDLPFDRPAPRLVIYTDAEIRALVAAADASGRASIGDAVLLGLFTCQRQGDRLALEDAGLVNGRRVFRQHKTGAVVAIPETPALAARLAAAKARVAAMMLRLGVDKEKRPAEIVISETTGRAYLADTFRHDFADVRALAAKGSNALALAPCPALAGKRDQDLRDTGVTWLARAGATLPEIASISGHSLRSIHDILVHYLAITPELADSAIAKLVAWMEREGMAV